MRPKNITKPWSPRNRQVNAILNKTHYSRERQATFPFTEVLPKYLLFSSTPKNIGDPRSSYRLQIHSADEQMLPPGWQKSTAFPWAR